MDPRLAVSDSVRKTTFTLAPTTPLLTLAWRALRAEHERRADDRKQGEVAERQLRELLAVVAEAVHGMQQALATAGVEPRPGEPASENAQFRLTVERLASRLQTAGLTIVAPPPGEPYVPELMDVLENVAQTPDPAATEPRVREVITPAILFHGGLLRMGKAVIAVPSPSAPTGDDKAAPATGTTATED